MKIVERKRNKYGYIKAGVAFGCEKGMTASEIAEMLNTTPHTVYSVAKRMSMNPRHVFFLKRRYKHGGLKKAVIEYYNCNMSLQEISIKTECRKDEVARIIRKHKAKNNLI